MLYPATLKYLLTLEHLKIVDYWATESNPSRRTENINAQQNPTDRGVDWHPHVDWSVGRSFT